MVRFPKCRTCGKEHALGGCPEFQSVGAQKVAAVTTANEFDPHASIDTPHKFGVKAIDDFEDQGRKEPPRPSSESPKPKIGRPRTGFNKKEYNRQFTADLRALRRLGLDCTVKEYRAMKEMENAGHKIQERED